MIKLRNKEVQASNLDNDECEFTATNKAKPKYWLV
jgi:hypothetical protein